MAAIQFLRGCFRLVTRGGRGYWTWIAVLLVLIGVGIHGYARQAAVGLIATHLRDQVSWGFYIGNFTFLVGVAAAAILLVVPAYVYHWKPIKEVAILGELLAVSAIVMCLLFVLCDMGRPDRLWEMIPFIGSLNVPRSILAWDTLVLNTYLAINLIVIVYLLFKAFMRREYNKSIVVPLVLASIPLAVSIHTVTAFVYNGLVARPFWNASILAPRFIASAFCSGPAILLVLFQLLRRTTRFHISDEAIWKVAELMAYAMFFNLFLLGAELFKEYYSSSEHLVFTQYLYTGIGTHHSLVPFAWTAMACDVIAFLLFLVPRTRRHWVTLNVGCLLIYCGVYIEKGMGLVIPGMTPDTLGDIYEYTPTRTEVEVAAGVFAVGFLVFTLLVKVAVPILMGEFSVDDLHENATPEAVAAA
jgi:molybdopterin-containing oxidoreductase family membrane subunit